MKGLYNHRTAHAVELADLLHLKSSGPVPATCSYVQVIIIMTDGRPVQNFISYFQGPVSYSVFIRLTSPCTVVKGTVLSASFRK